MSDWYFANLVLIQATLTGLLLALSVQVPLRMGVFSFAGVGSYGIGAYAAALLVIHQQMPARCRPSASAVLVTAVIGLVLGLMIARLAGLYLAMATVAFDLIIGGHRDQRRHIHRRRRPASTGSSPTSPCR